jgi:hypothetical protein
MSKHTPGPWRAEKYDATSTLVTVCVIGDWRVGAESHRAGGNYRDFDYGSEEADARLIAAAPCLLSVVRDFVATMEPQVDGWDRKQSDLWAKNVQVTMQLYRAACAAIATGRVVEQSGTAAADTSVRAGARSTDAISAVPNGRGPDIGNATAELAAAVVEILQPMGGPMATVTGLMNAREKILHIARAAIARATGAA